MNQFVFNLEKSNAITSLKTSLSLLLRGEKPIIVCVGSDLAVGDSLGPLTGEFLKNEVKDAYIYGSLSSPITAKEIEKTTHLIKLLHPNSKILVIDAAVGQKEDIGLVKINQGGIMPGLGVNKNFSLVGDVSIIGIVAEKENAFINLSKNTRLNLVYNMSKNIASSISLYLK